MNYYWWWYPYGEDILAAIAALDSKLDQLILQGVKMDKELADLEAQVKANTDAEASAIVVLNGIADAIAKAVAAAQGAGATPAQLAKIAELQSALAASAAPLAAAVVTGTDAETPKP